MRRQCKDQDPDLAIRQRNTEDHLWHIDVLINRTLLYATLTGTLILVYIGLVLVLQYLLRDFIRPQHHTQDISTTKHANFTLSTFIQL